MPFEIPSGTTDKEGSSLLRRALFKVELTALSDYAGSEPLRRSRSAKTRTEPFIRGERTIPGAPPSRRGAAPAVELGNV